MTGMFRLLLGVALLAAPVLGLGHDDPSELRAEFRNESGHRIEVGRVWHQNLDSGRSSSSCAADDGAHCTMNLYRGRGRDTTEVRLRVSLLRDDHKSIDEVEEHCDVKRETSECPALTIKIWIHEDPELGEKRNWEVTRKSEYGLDIAFDENERAFRIRRK